MRCPNCQATNPDSADFCGQCYQRFTPVQAEPAPPLPSPQTPAEDGGREAQTPQQPVSGSAGRFRVEGDRVGWTCAVCGQDNDVSDFTCPVCGTRMDAEASADGGVDWAAARRVETFAPGVGHLRAGIVGMGAVRVVMVGLWLLGALLLASTGGIGVLAAIPLVVGVGIIWLTGPGDLDAARAGRKPTLDPRRFMFLVVGVTVGMILLGGLGAVL